ncbi:MAG: two-component system response regulator [Myxococcaceae bacterium]
MTAPRVIVSDDEAPLVRSLARLFRREGVETFEDPTSDVVAMSEREQPNLVLVDLHQAVSGLELLKRLKANPNTAKIRVVIMSGDNSDRDRQASLSAGADDFLVKPFGVDVVRALANLIRSGP